MSRQHDGDSRLGEDWWRELTLTAVFVIIIAGNALILLDSWPASLVSRSSAYFLVAGLACLVGAVGYLAHERSLI